MSRLIKSIALALVVMMTINLAACAAPAAQTAETAAAAAESARIRKNQYYQGMITGGKADVLS